MANVKEVCDFLNGCLRIADFADFPGSYNGLQFENSGKVAKLAAATDCGIEEIKAAKKWGADMLLVHHGIFWNSPIPVTGANYEKFKLLADSDMAVFSAHLPLDANRRFGDSSIIAKKLGLEYERGAFKLDGEDISIVVKAPSGGRAELAKRLKKLFPKTYKGFEFGSKNPKNLVIAAGSGSTSIMHLLDEGTDTMICGELKQGNYVYAQDNKLNVYPCGHYATESFGIDALGRHVAKHFGFKYKHITSQNPL